MDRDSRGERFGTPLRIAALGVIAVSLLVATASFAAAPVAGRAYLGSVGKLKSQSGGGSGPDLTGRQVSFTVSADGRSVSAFQVPGVEGQLPCSQASSGAVTSWSAPVHHGRFTIDTVTSSRGIIVTGTFGAHGKVSGTVLLEGHAPISGSTVCTRTFAWSAAAEPKDVAFCPGVGNPYSSTTTEDGIVATGVSCQVVTKALNAGTYTPAGAFSTRGWTCTEQGSNSPGASPRYRCARKRPLASFTFT